MGAKAWKTVALTVCLAASLFTRAQAAEDEDATVILFSGRDLWRNGVFLYGGFLLAPGGSTRTGCF